MWLRKTVRKLETCDESFVIPLFRFLTLAVLLVDSSALQMSHLACHCLWRRLSCSLTWCNELALSNPKLKALVCGIVRLGGVREKWGVVSSLVAQYLKDEASRSASHMIGGWAGLVRCKLPLRYVFLVQQGAKLIFGVTFACSVSFNKR